MSIPKSALWPRPTLVLLGAALLPVLAGCAGAPREHVVAAPSQPPPNESPGWEVISGFGPHDATIGSVLRSETVKDLPHGLQVTTERGWLREAAVYDHGVLTRHFYFHRNGYPFIASYKDAAGDGRVEIWHEATLVFTGIVRGNKRWVGSFLVIEVIPTTYGRRQFMLHEYRDGEIVRREPFPFDRVDVEPPNNPVNPTNWPWGPLDWPSPPQMVAPD